MCRAPATGLFREAVASRDPLFARRARRFSNVPGHGVSRQPRGHLLDEQKLQEAEARKQAFRLKYLGLLGTSGKNYLHQMEAVGEQIKEARVQIRVAEQTRDGLRRQLEEQTTGGNATNPKAVPRIAVPEIDARIDAQKRQLDELLRKYTDHHPDVVGVKRTMARLEDERNAEIEARAKAAADKPDPSFSGNPIAQQLKVALNESEATVTTARARLGEHEARYNQLRAAAESLPKIETELGQLERDYDVQKRQYDSLIQRRETANLSGKLEDANVAEFRIVEPPRGFAQAGRAQSAPPSCRPSRRVACSRARQRVCGEPGEAHVSRGACVGRGCGTSAARHHQRRPESGNPPPPAAFHAGLRRRNGRSPGLLRRHLCIHPSSRAAGSCDDTV